MKSVKKNDRNIVRQERTSKDQRYEGCEAGDDVWTAAMTKRQWRSQGGGTGAMAPPQTFGECFFLQLIYVVTFF